MDPFLRIVLSKLQSPKAMNYYAEAGLLTYSRFILPSHPPEAKSGFILDTVMENTAAGLSGILTRFPFNSEYDFGNLKHRKFSISFNKFK
jgi:hypothetical protein